MSALGCFADAFFDAALGEKDLYQLSVQAVAALVGDEVAHQLAAGQCYVANQIERFMANALVFHAERVVDGTFVAEHEQILVRDPLAEAALAKPLSFGGE